MVRKEAKVRPQTPPTTEEPRVFSFLPPKEAIEALMGFAPRAPQKAVVQEPVRPEFSPGPLTLRKQYVAVLGKALEHVFSSHRDRQEQMQRFGITITFAQVQDIREVIADLPDPEDEEDLFRKVSQAMQPLANIKEAFLAQNTIYDPVIAPFRELGDTRTLQRVLGRVLPEYTKAVESRSAG